MSYHPLLDALFSHWYLHLGLLCLLGGLAFFIYARFVSKWKLRWLYSGGCLLVLFVWLMVAAMWNAEYLGLGSPDGVDGVVLDGERLLVVDYLLGGGSEGIDPTPFSRIHVLNAATGEKRLRFPAGDHVELLGVQGDSLIVSYYLQTTIFDATTGRAFVTWDRETLPAHFPELAVGIDNTSVDREAMVLEITTLDGNHWALDLATSKLGRVDPALQRGYRFDPLGRLYIAGDDEIRVDDTPGGRRLLHLAGMGGQEEIAYLKDGHDSILNPELQFLGGKMIALSEGQQCIVILSFETTQETGFILTGVSLDGKTRLWELRQRVLRPGDDLTRESSFGWDADAAAGILYFAVQDEVMALREATGQIVWRQGL